MTSYKTPLLITGFGLVGYVLRPELGLIVWVKSTEDWN